MNIFKLLIYISKNNKESLKMPADKTLTQKYQEMVEILRELTDSLARIEERLEFYSEKQDKLENQFDKHIEHAGKLLERMVELERDNSNMTHTQIVEELHTIKTRVTAIETTFKDFPHNEVVKDIQMIRQELAPYKKLFDEHRDVPERLKELETADNSSKDRWKIFTTYFLNTIVYLIGVLIASYLLWRFGLQPPNVP